MSERRQRAGAKPRANQQATPGEIDVVMAGTRADHRQTLSSSRTVTHVPEDVRRIVGDDTKLSSGRLLGRPLVDPE